MTPADMDVAIVGGGIVGLSCAFALAAKGRSVLLCERRARLGEETSTHNSGVIHAGIYYDPGSLKARLCVEGRRRLLERLKNWRVMHRISGKLILATEPSEEPVLEALLDRGRANDVESLRLIDAREALALEPAVSAIRALSSPGTGVFDVGEYLRVLEIQTREKGATIATNTEVTGVDRTGHSLTIHTNERGAITARSLVNCAGLYADVFAKLCGDDRHTIYPCRGEYASVIPTKANLINGLVYPVPADVSLGVHLTKTVGGELWLGPTARFIENKTDYEGDRIAPAEFLPEARKLCPALKAEDLRVGPSGIRPKRYGPGDKALDFHIEPQPDEPRILHLVGIESPGLTASPAIGELVENMVRDILH